MVTWSSSTGTSVMPPSRAIATLEFEVPKSIPQATGGMVKFSGRKLQKIVFTCLGV
jgi:hypothetical protein